MQKSANPCEHLPRSLLDIFKLICVSCALNACSSLTLDTGKEGQLEVDASKMCLERRGSVQKVPTRLFRTDGCSLWPHGNWQACCIVHDMVYWCGGDRTFRKQADNELRACVSSSGHRVIGSLMWLGTRAGGLRIWPAPWRWGYGWEWLQKMQHQDAEDGSN